MKGEILTFNCVLDPNDTLTAKFYNTAAKGETLCLESKLEGKVGVFALSPEDAQSLVRMIDAVWPQAVPAPTARDPLDPDNWSKDEQTLHRLRCQIAGMSLGPISAVRISTLVDLAARLIEEKRMLAEVSDTLAQSQLVAPEIELASDGEAW